MKHVAIIGASFHQLPLIETAKRMGYTTHVFAWECGDVGETAADHFYPISIVEKEQILEECRRIGICGICSIASDLAMLTVNYVANALGLVGNTPEATEVSTNKHLMRQAFERNGDPSPWSIQVDENTDISALDLTFPAIVKPTDRSGSRGICRVERREELAPAIREALSCGFEKKALIEEFVTGDEFSVEYISYAGEHRFLALTEKTTTGAPHFIETEHREPARVTPEELGRIQAVVEHALDTLGLDWGASHSELKLDRATGRIRLIEIGGRMGGDAIGSHLVRYSTGMDFVAMVLQVACGEAPDFTPVCEPRAVCSRFIFTREDLEAFERLRRETPERLLDVLDLHPENIGHTTDSANRAGCYICLA